MSKCTFCGREGEEKTKFVGGYEILECCTDCEEEILEDTCKIYKADYADDNFEIIRASTDDEALREAWDMEKEHERLFNLFEVDEDFEEIRTIV